MTEPWLTQRELAAALKVSPRTIRRHVRPDLVVGRQNRYYKTSAEAQLRGEDGPLPENVVELRPRRGKVAA